MGCKDGRCGWLGRRRRWRWAQRTGRGSSGWPACAQPRLSPGVFGSRFPPQFLLFKQLDRTYPAERRGLRFLRRADCAFPSHHCPGGAGPNRPPACGALWKMAQLGKRARATPRQAVGGLRQGPQASAWGPAARKDAVWAEGLADGAPWARPGHHQAASCGLRRYRELRVMAKTDRS